MKRTRPLLTASATPTPAAAPRKAVAPKKPPAGPMRENALQKINRLDVKGRIQLALKGNKEERSLLIRDGTKVVALAVLEAPKLSDGEVEKFASQKNVLESVLRQIPLKRRFMKNYKVVRNLVSNPRTPLDLGLGLMKHLLIADLKNISANKEVSETVRKLALKMYKQKGRPGEQEVARSRALALAWLNPIPSPSLLTRAKTIAVVGLSSNPLRPSHGVSAYMQSHGYRIIPVNPKIEECLGEKAYASLLDVPEKIDIVNIFRRPEFVEEVVDQAIQLKVPAIWMQEDVIHEKAAEKARQAGIFVVMDRCILKEHRDRMR